MLYEPVRTYYPYIYVVRALEDEKIRAVGLDVTVPEPLPVDHKLYQFPNCIILPHIASATSETREQMATMALDNIVAVANGQPIPFGL
jgi:glyoxylate/hydroxypyruvate reductase